MATIPPATTNGVNVQQLVDTIGLIKKDSSLARFRFRSRTRWESGGRCETEIAGFYGAGAEMSRPHSHALAGDEPPVLLGSDTAPNAVEAVLHALAACLTVGYVYNAAARGITIRSLRFDAEGDLDLHAFLGLSDRTRPGFERITFVATVKADASREKLEELCDYVQRTSPVLDIVRNPVPVSIELVTE
ncbi:MAG TPA: OsmC family protein [Candidatus Limnocylindria bacterium]|nr:OsmC family protein [Candidatus Limnocylindria bacterium]